MSKNKITCGRCWKEVERTTQVCVCDDCLAHPSPAAPDLREIYEAMRDFCGHNMSDEKRFPDRGTCAWKDGYMAGENDPECNYENCPFVKAALTKGKPK